MLLSVIDVTTVHKPTGLGADTVKISINKLVTCLMIDQVLILVDFNHNIYHFGIKNTNYLRIKCNRVKVINTFYFSH